MFTHTCTACSRRQLIFPSQISAMDTLAPGVIALAFTCWCGEPQTALTGRQVSEGRQTVDA